MRLLKIVPDDTNIDFVRLRYWAFGLTTLLTIAAIALVVVNKLNMGVDFVGGIMIEEKFQTPPDVEKVRSVIDGLHFGDAQIQTVGDQKTLSIRLPRPETADDAATNRIVNAVSAALVKNFAGAQFSKQDAVSGKVSGELVWNGILAVVVAVLLIGLFAIFRFEWQFGVSTVVAIVHDVLMTMGFFALTQLEFDLNIVAALLTLIGYSLNDTIVVYDRVRENLRKYRKMQVPDLLDLSVNETLSRTIVTSLSMLITLIALLLLGPDVIFGFTAAITLGIFVGTYSSIYMATPILIWLGVTSDSFVASDNATDRAEKFATEG